MLDKNGYQKGEMHFRKTVPNYVREFHHFSLQTIQIKNSLARNGGDCSPKSILPFLRGCPATDYTSQSLLQLVTAL